MLYVLRLLCDIVLGRVICMENEGQAQEEEEEDKGGSVATSLRLMQTCGVNPGGVGL